MSDTELSSIHPVSKHRHGSKGWNRYKSYSFASGDSTAPIVVAEFARACMVFPIAFVNTGENFSPIAILGVVPGQNLYVAPSGQWLGGYIPSAYRGYPFRLGKTPEGQRLLCIDERSGLISELVGLSAEGERFFNETGEPEESIKQVLGFLSQIDDNRSTTTDFCDLLEVNKLLEPWPLTINAFDGDYRLEGLYRVSESALRSLKSRAVSALHKENFLLPAYCQILSMQSAPLLARLKEARANMISPVMNLPPPAPSGEIDFSFLGD